MDVGYTNLLGAAVPPYLIDACSAGVMRASGGSLIPTHRHQSHEIHYLRDGEVRLRIGKKTWMIVPGQLYTVAGGDSHSQQVISESVICYTGISVSHWSSWHAEDAMTQEKFEKAKDGRFALDRLFSRVYSPDDATKAAIEAFFSQLPKNGFVPVSSEIAKAFKRFIEAINSYMEEHERIAPALHGNLPSTKSPVVLDAIVAIQERFADDVSISELASQSCISQRHFRRLFHEALGTTPQQYVKELRFQRALDLLQNSRLKIDAVCEMSGFHNRGEFFRYFYERTGFTPEGFRKNMQASLSAPSGYSSQRS